MQDGPGGHQGGGRGERFKLKGVARIPLGGAALDGELQTVALHAPREPGAKAGARGEPCGQLELSVCFVPGDSLLASPGMSTREPASFEDASDML